MKLWNYIKRLFKSKPVDNTKTMGNSQVSTSYTITSAGKLIDDSGGNFADNSRSRGRPSKHCDDDEEEEYYLDEQQLFDELEAEGSEW